MIYEYIEELEQCFNERKRAEKYLDIHDDAERVHSWATNSLIYVQDEICMQATELDIRERSHWVQALREFIQEFPEYANELETTITIVGECE